MTAKHPYPLKRDRTIRTIRTVRRAVWATLWAVGAVLVVYGVAVRADVTGSFGINVLYGPLPCTQVVVGPAQTPANLGDQPCETTVYKLDFQGDLNVNVAISGLVVGLHSHLGNTGLEDTIVTFNAVLGVLDVYDEFVFAQPFGRVTDNSGTENFICYENAPGSGECDLFFVKKRVTASVGLGGLELTNLAMLEDVNFPDCTRLPGFLCDPVPPTPVYTPEAQSFGFGDVLTLQGQTPSGVTIRGATGLCAQYAYNLIKKHVWFYTVNPDCAAGTQTPSPKPPLFFDFESVEVVGVPLASDLTLTVSALCDQTTGFACRWTLEAAHTGSPLFNPIELSATFTSLAGPFTFSGGKLIVSAGSGTLEIRLDGTLEVDLLLATFQLTLNPDTNPATLEVNLTIDAKESFPGDQTGLEGAAFSLSVERAGLDLTLSALYAGNPVVLQRLSADLGSQAGAIDLAASAFYDFVAVGLGGSLSAAVRF